MWNLSFPARDQTHLACLARHILNHWTTGKSLCFGVFFFNIIVLQCCVRFCCATLWISCMCTYISSHSPIPISPLQVITEHQAELLVLYITFPLASYLTHNSVCIYIYMYIYIYIYIYVKAILSICPPLLPLTVSTRPFSTSVPLFMPCKWVHQYHFSRFHIYVLIHDICFSLSDLLHSVWQARLTDLLIMNRLWQM